MLTSSLAGESFSTGDILLEIETDKAQMDVEAQDDGKMAKITVLLPLKSYCGDILRIVGWQQEAGSKGIKVGTRIAVLAEPDDDLSALSLPTEESSSTRVSPENFRSSIGASNPSESPPSPKAEDSPHHSKPSPPSTAFGKPRGQHYSLSPSIAQLLHENGLSSSEADKIPASGPKGRLLKGDVLGYLGKISSSYSSEQSMRITRLGHLDLSKVQPASPRAVRPSRGNEAQAQEATEPIVEVTGTEIAIPISLASVISVQNRIQATLGLTLPLSTFIARATDLANHDLPRSPATRPSADELFNSVLGLDKVSPKPTRGRYLPQITALPTKPSTEKAGPRRQLDVYDVLTNKHSTTISMGGNNVSPPNPKSDLGTGDSTKVFSVSAEKGQEKQARVFLEKVKTILQIEPGRLIL